MSLRLSKSNALLTACEISGQTWYPELEWIYDTFANSRSHVEIGTWGGRSLFVAAQAMRPKSSIYTIDARVHHEIVPVQLIEDISRIVASHCPADVQIHMLKTTSLQASIDLNSKFDSVFIDGDHAYDSVLADIECWLPKVKSGGIICGHDYWPNHWGVMEAVQKIFRGAHTIVPRTRIWFMRV